MSLCTEVYVVVGIIGFRSFNLIPTCMSFLLVNTCALVRTQWLGRGQGWRHGRGTQSRGGSVDGRYVAPSQ